jgi:malic enzyme
VLIPIFHDDQHGTAIISAAGLINAVEIGSKDMSKIRVVFLGAGASAIACAKLYELCGVRHENIYMADSKGLLYEGRAGMNKYKDYFATKSGMTEFKEAMDGADVFVGLSKKDALTNEDFARMAPNPIVFAMANPDPEITPERAASIRTDHIMATGRSDYPNQINNVLGFPFIFRGALDVRAKAITDGMKLAASHALAALAKEDVPDADALRPPGTHLGGLRRGAGRLGRRCGPLPDQGHRGVQVPARAAPREGPRDHAGHDHEGEGLPEANCLSRGRPREDHSRRSLAQRRGDRPSDPPRTKGRHPAKGG